MWKWVLAPSLETFAWEGQKKGWKGSLGRSSEGIIKNFISGVLGGILAELDAADLIFKCKPSAYGMCQDFFPSVERFVLEYSIILTTSCIKIWKLIPKIPQVQAGSHGGAELWLPKPGESANRGTRDKLQALFFFFKCFIHFRVCLPV